MKPTDRKPPNLLFGGLLACCLSLAVCTNAGTVFTDLRTWWSRAAEERPYDLRLELSDYYRHGVRVAREIRNEFDPDIPIVIHVDDVPQWFLALRLQPRRVYTDRPDVRRRLATEERHYLVAHLEKKLDTVQWWFEYVNTIRNSRVVSGREPAVFADGFEDQLSAWSVDPTGEEQ